MQEQNSDRVDELFLEADSIEVSFITRIELNSAIARRLSDKSLDRKSCNTALAAFNRECGYFTIITYTQAVEAEAINLIKKYQMKTLDGFGQAGRQGSICHL